MEKGKVKAAISENATFSSHHSKIRKECTTKQQNSSLKQEQGKIKKLGYPITIKREGRVLERLIPPPLEQFPIISMITKRKGNCG